MKIVLLLMLLSPSAYGVGCPTGQAKDEAALVAIEHNWLRAVEQHDSAALACILADEFEEADFDGSLINRSTMLAGATKPQKGHDELEDLHAHIYGEVAYVRGIGCTWRMAGLREKRGSPTSSSIVTDAGNVSRGTNLVFPNREVWRETGSSRFIDRSRCVSIRGPD